jgi:hypothetical protein
VEIGRSAVQIPIREKKKALAEASAFLELLSRFEPPCISVARCPLEDPIGGQQFKY